MFSFEVARCRTVSASGPASSVRLFSGKGNDWTELIE